MEGRKSGREVEQAGSADRLTAGDGDTVLTTPEDGSHGEPVGSHFLEGPRLADRERRQTINRSNALVVQASSLLLQNASSTVLHYINNGIFRYCQCLLESTDCRTRQTAGGGTGGTVLTTPEDGSHGEPYGSHFLEGPRLADRERRQTINRLNALVVQASSLLLCNASSTTSALQQQRRLQVLPVPSGIDRLTDS